MTYNRDSLINTLADHMEASGGLDEQQTTEYVSDLIRCSIIAAQAAGYALSEYLQEVGQAWDAERLERILS